MLNLENDSFFTFFLLQMFGSAPVIINTDVTDVQSLSVAGGWGAMFY